MEKSKKEMDNIRRLLIGKMQIGILNTVLEQINLYIRKIIKKYDFLSSCTKNIELLRKMCEDLSYNRGWGRGTSSDILDF